MNFPENLKYSKDHEWIMVDGDKATVFGSIEAVKTVSDLMMPVKGEVLEFNEKLEDTPELVNSDPYGDGWIIKISIDDVAELDDLLDASAYKDFVEK